MPATAGVEKPFRRTPGRFILLGGLTVGLLDLIDGIVFFGFRGVAPIRIPQSIAAGLLGRPAFQGGLRTAALGLLLHFSIATTIVGVLYVISGWFPALTRRPIVAAVLYGLAVYVTMNYVVVPLSNAGSAAPPLPVLANGLLIHVFGVGLPSVLFVRAARG